MFNSLAPALALGSDQIWGHWLGHLALTWNGAQQDLWLSKLRFLASVDDITHHGQLTAPTQLQADTWLQPWHPSSNRGRRNPERALGEPGGPPPHQPPRLLAPLR